MNEHKMEVLKFKFFLDDIDKKIDELIHDNFSIRIAKVLTYHNTRDRNVTIVDLIFFNRKTNNLILELCEKSFLGGYNPEIDIYELTELNEKNRYSIIQKIIEEYNSEKTNSMTLKKEFLRYIFYALLGTVIIEESKEEVELISDLIVCLDIKSDEVSDIISVIKYITIGVKFEFITDICKEIFLEVVNEQN